MNTKQLQLVTFEQAKRLKQLGFDWNVGYFYNPASKQLKPNFIIRAEEGEFLTADYFLVDNNYDRKHPKISAPSVALALKWMRDEKGFDYSITNERLYNEYGYSLLNGTTGRLHIKGGYEAAENALLDELLTILEEEKEQ
jgi:hypothetical protein